MVDYQMNTGTTGRMMIRDTGSLVQFWINSFNSTTFHHALPWGYTVGGVTNNSRTYNYIANSGWQKLIEFTLTVDQNVTFRLFDTGTAGFGGPTTFTHAIERSSAPSAPPAPALSNITTTSFFATVTDGANGGDPIDFRQIGRNTVNNNASGVTTTNINSGSSITVGALTPGTLYYVWARTHNSKGYSPWSALKTVTTLTMPGAPDPVIVSDVTQTSAVASFTDGSTGGSPILERQLVLNTVNNTTGAFTFTYTGVTTIINMQPATDYYWWGRVRTAAGWSPYSPVTLQRTIAGAWVNVGGIWKEAVPYVRDGGVWKLARPWSRAAGIWKETT